MTGSVQPPAHPSVARFTTTVLLGGKTATGLEVPPDVVEVEIVLDTALRVVEVPADLAEATRTRRVAGVVDALAAGGRS